MSGILKLAKALGVKLAPQEEALRVAQENAVKMLGLPPGNTPMDRARAMGGVDVFHGTNNDVKEISLEMSGAKTGNPNAALGFFTSPNPSEASRYSMGWGKEGANVMPLVAIPRQTYQMPFKELDDLAMLPYKKMMADPNYDPNKKVKFGDVKAQKEAEENLKKWQREAVKESVARRNDLIQSGFDSAVVNKGKPTEEFIAINPSIIRSRFAAFDPARINENNLLASRLLPFALPGLLALPQDE